eukprot:GFKZ01000166.1.p1 GENE.GFKZ01000166.1~~GFKZ01000166.1.p1  ORF type:complete len:345 (+),score=30.04 GFKZ01000166.1:24-1037(+)
MSAKGNWAIAIHGGAGGLPRDTVLLPYEQTLEASVNAAHDVLVSGAAGAAAAPWRASRVPLPPTAVAAALAAVEVMEESPLFNAGRGAVLNARDFCENEALVMDGATLRIGAVTGLRTIMHPARLAALINVTADFQFLGFAAAERFASKYPTLIETREPAWFLTDRRKLSLARAKQRRAAELDHSSLVASGGVEEAEGEVEGGTVGATVCDGQGNVACVTSTGGVTNKLEGRIGDTPVVGAGSYASNKSCALSGTGWGEDFLRFSAASRVCFAVEYGGLSVRDALAEVVHQVMPEGTGGFIGVTPGGEVHMELNSPMMFRACRNWQGVNYVKTWADQ